MAATNPKMYGDAIVYKGGEIPLPAVMEEDFYAWAAKRYTSGLYLKVKELEDEIEQTKQEIERTYKFCPPGHPGRNWVKVLEVQIVSYTAAIEKCKAEIVFCEKNGRAIFAAEEEEAAKMSK